MHARSGGTLEVMGLLLGEEHIKIGNIAFSSVFYDGHILLNIYFFR